MDVPHQQEPVVQRLRLKYAKRGRLRFTSHRDFSRAFERALRRAKVPIAFSSGFSPHPRVSYANATPTGVASEAEYLEIALNQVVDPDAVRASLDAALPPGLDLIEVVEARSSDFASRLEASRWQLVLPGVEPEAAAAASAALLAETEVIVERMTKDGVRRFDARAAICSLELAKVQPAPPGEIGQLGAAIGQLHSPSAILAAVVRNGSPSVRPDDLLAALRVVAGLVPSNPPLVTRLAQGPLNASGSVVDPFDPDRE
ncbi:MAG TPA: TIGR03936 family radical SAM-associated protein [Candidatus Nanopelagicaceae bacterium]|nr:TIGR03936 family radical SAM-associated protein [Candidatus Nanopelagicaceae bacterium]